MRDQMAKMSPDKSCGQLTGDQRAMCEAQIQQSIARIDSICPR
jgi:hypothetical protein